MRILQLTIVVVVFSGDEEGLGDKSENGSVVNQMKCLNSVCNFSSIREAAERQRSKVYSEVLRSYDSRIDRLEGAKNKILRYNWNLRSVILGIFLFKFMFSAKWNC